jgi:hypothetical protein
MCCLFIVHRPVALVESSGIIMKRQGCGTWCRRIQRFIHYTKMNGGHSSACAFRKLPANSLTALVNGNLLRSLLQRLQAETVTTLPPKEVSRPSCSASSLLSLASANIPHRPASEIWTTSSEFNLVKVLLSVTPQKPKLLWGLGNRLKIPAALDLDAEGEGDGRGMVMSLFILTQPPALLKLLNLPIH